MLAGGEVIRTGGRFVKSSAGYDLTQLLVGSEGTLALVTEATLKLEPRLAHPATVLAPFATSDEVTAAVPVIVASGVAPTILEYLDMLAMGSITAGAGLDLGRPRSHRGRGPRLPGGGPGVAPTRTGSRRTSSAVATLPTTGRWTSTCCPPPPAPT